MSFVDLFVLINKGRRRRRTKSEIMSLCRATTHLLEHRKWTNNSDLLDFEEVCVTIPLCTYVHKVPRAEFIIERRFQSKKGCARTTFVFHLSVSDVEIIDKWLEAIKWWITIWNRRAVRELIKKKRNKTEINHLRKSWKCSTDSFLGVSRHSFSIT